MSDKIYEYLMQLFAVVASVREASDMGERRMIVYNFLVSQLNSDLANKYIGIFDVSYRENLRQARKAKVQYKHISRITSRVMRLTVQMNSELSLYQKYIVLIQLYEYLNTGQVSYIERGLVEDVVAEKFNVERDEFLMVRNFVMNTQSVPDRIVFSDKEHCEEILEPKHVFREDLGGDVVFLYLSKVNIFMFKCLNSTAFSMNNTALVPGHTYIMRTGNSIRNGVSAPIFFSDMMRHAVINEDVVPITIEARNVEYLFSKNVVGLRNISFEAHSGQLVGIMGVSGSGKSTFLNVMSGMARPSKGNVYINNIDIYEDSDLVEGLVGYVSQDDILMEDLTVYDNLYYNARMSFDDLSLPMICERIDKLLNTLGLYEVKDVKVGSPLNKKISGGQRKRLNIALELIREPAVLFLDEPTSGLSSHDSEKLIELLKDLSINGKLIFVVIHQPSSEIFKMFDHLLILDTGGYLIYKGNPIESLNYFREALNMPLVDIECHRCGNINVEEVLDIISQPILDEYGNATDKRKKTPEEWQKRLDWGDIANFGHYVGDPEPLPSINFKVPGRLKQLGLYISRDVKSKLANLQYVLINLLEAPLLGFFLAMLLRYYDVSTDKGYDFYSNPNIPVYIVVAVIVAFFIGLTVSAEEIIQDRQILKREQFLNLSRTSYVLSKCLQVMVLSALQMLLFTVVANSVLGISGMLFEYWLVLFSTSVSANMIGLNISDMMKKTVNIYIMIPFLVIPQLILSGVFVRFDKMNPDVSSKTSVPFYGQVITTRWAFEALIVNQFIYNDYEVLFYQYDKAKSQCSYYKDYWIPTLKSKLDKASRLMTESTPDMDAIQEYLDVVCDEIHAPSNRFPNLEPPRANVFKSGLYGQAVYGMVVSYLESVRQYNVSRYNKVDLALNQFRESHQSDELENLRKRCANKSVTDFVTNQSGVLSAEIIKEYDGRLWQMNDQVFQETDKALGAPLFSPYKCFWGEKIDTYLFDLLVIWALNLFFLIVLVDGSLAKKIRG